MSRPKLFARYSCRHPHEVSTVARALFPLMFRYLVQCTINVTVAIPHIISLTTFLVVSYLPTTHPVIPDGQGTEDMLVGSCPTPGNV